jgi:hypothetical protein
VREFRAEICKRYVLDSQFDTFSLERLMELTRVWKFEGDEDIDDAQVMIKEVGSNYDKLPLAI